VSGYEAAGRWTEGSKASFVFERELPQSFVLGLELGAAFGPNVGRPIRVSIGDWQGEFTGSAAGTSIKFNVKTSVPADTVDFLVPEPKSPKELGISDDPRALGIYLIKLNIISQ
jgi:hypothetical protein